MGVLSIFASCQSDLVRASFSEWPVWATLSEWPCQSDHVRMTCQRKLSVQLCQSQVALHWLIILTTKILVWLKWISQCLRPIVVYWVAQRLGVSSPDLGGFMFRMCDIYQSWWSIIASSKTLEFVLFYSIDFHSLPTIFSTHHVLYLTTPQCLSQQFTHL